MRIFNLLQVMISQNIIFMKRTNKCKTLSPNDSNSDGKYINRIEWVLDQNHICRPEAKGLLEVKSLSSRAHEKCPHNDTFVHHKLLLTSNRPRFHLILSLPASLKARCSYRMNERGAMTISLNEHVLEPEIFPGKADGSDVDAACEELLKAIQVSVPFEVSLHFHLSSWSHEYHWLFYFVLCLLSLA